MKMIYPKIQIWFILVLLSLGFAACQQRKERSEKPQSIDTAQVYDEQADARLDINHAIDRAGMTNKKILLIFGANWCSWCKSLHHLFETDQEIRQYLKQHFEVVLIDVGRRDKNMDLSGKYGNPVDNGLPVIVVLDSAGNYLATQETGALELPPSQEHKYGHDRTKVLNFLRHWGETIQAT